MKNLYTTLALLVLTQMSINAQTIGRDVISTSGGEKTHADLKLSWTIGQSGLMGTLSGDEAILTLGFEQDNDDKYVAVFNIDEYEVIAAVSPNPVINNPTLQITSDLQTEFKYRLIDTKGQTVLISESFVAGKGITVENIPMISLAPGLYYFQLIVSSQNQHQVQQTIKLIKI